MSKPHVLITGAGRGIGAAIAKQFADRGYALSLLGRNSDVLEAQVKILDASAQSIVCDITDPKLVASAFALASKSFGAPSVLVNNAGAAHAAPFVKTQPQQFQAMLDVNYLGACYCIQEALPAMLENKHGRIVNVGSTSSVKGYAYVLSLIHI